LRDFFNSLLGDGWDVLAQFYTVESRAVAVTGEGEVDTLFVSWSAPATLSGTVRSQGSGAPVEGARVSIEDRRVRALTNESGEFSIRGLGAGPLVVSVSSIGFATRVDTVLAASGAHIALEISIGEQAIELDPLVVTARAPPVRREREMRNLGMSALGMNQAEINEALPRAIDFVSLLRWANIPGLLISQGSGVGSIGTCIQFHRGTTATNIDTPNCSMLAVYVNGVRMPNGSVLVESLDPTIVEEFIVLRPAFAQFQYMGPLTANGVLDIILR